jgi:hydrogenase expression/formation protein HypC
LAARVIRVQDDGTAVVEATGARRQVSAELLDDLEPGDFVMVHAGSAIARITDDDEDETDGLVEEFL